MAETELVGPVRQDEELGQPVAQVVVERLRSSGTSAASSDTSNCEPSTAACRRTLRCADVSRSIWAATTSSIDSGRLPIPPAGPA